MQGSEEVGETEKGGKQTWKEEGVRHDRKNAGVRQNGRGEARKQQNEQRRRVPTERHGEVRVVEAPESCKEGALSRGSKNKPRN